MALNHASRIQRLLWRLVSKRRWRSRLGAHPVLDDPFTFILYRFHTSNWLQFVKDTVGLLDYTEPFPQFAESNLLTVVDIGRPLHRSESRHCPDYSAHRGFAL